MHPFLNHRLLCVRVQNLMFVLFTLLIVGSVGCDPPKDELNLRPGEPEVKPVPVQKTVAPPPVVVEPPPPSPKDILDSFLAKKPIQFTDQDLKTVAELPDEFLSQITTLDLSGSQVTDAGLPALAKLQGLTELSVQGNKFSEAGYGYIGELQNLEVLRVDSSPTFSNAALKQLSKLTKLKIFSAGTTGITDAGIDTIAAFSDLEQLNVSVCQINGSGFKELKSLGSIKILSVHHTTFAEFGFAAIQGWKSLDELDARECGVSDLGLKMLKGCSNLRIVDLGYNRGITDLGMKQLVALKKLEKIVLRHTSITNQGVLLLKVLKSAKYIDVDGTSCTVQILPAIKKALPDVEINVAGSRN